MPSMFSRRGHREMCIILKRRRGTGGVGGGGEGLAGWMEDRWNLPVRGERERAKRFLPIIDGAPFDLRAPPRRVC